MTLINHAIAAWAGAEERIYRYFVDKLQSVAGVTGYRGELPREIQYASDAQMWFFEMTGGSDIIQIRSAKRPLCTWRMNGYLRGIFIDRDTAQTVIGMAMTNLPVDPGEIQDVKRVAIVSMPTIQRGDIQLSSDGERGGLIRVWAVELPLDVLFSNTNYSAEA